MKKLAIIALAATAMTTFATAEEQENPFAIRTFFGFTTGDVKDLIEINNVYGVGFEYKMRNASNMGGSWHLGAEYAMSSEGNGLKVDNFGLYLGGEFALDKNTGNKLSFVVNAGYFSTVLHQDEEATYNTGFGFDAGFRYKMPSVTIELLYRQRPDIANSSDLDNRSFSIGFLWPVKF